MTLLLPSIVMVRDLPFGYQVNLNVPRLLGSNYCMACLCAPCVVQQPPSYLQGQCDPHPANSEKRHMLYKFFWRTLKDLKVWRDEGYLLRKEERTARDDKRDIIPDCIIKV